MPRHMTPDEISEALELYARGATRDELCLKFDRGLDTIGRMIKRHNAQRAQPNPRKNHSLWRQPANRD